MEYADIPQSFESAESFGFLAVPIPVPPMIEAAFRYCGRERFVSLGFGVRGGVMSDFVEDSRRPRSRYLYRSFLIHPAMRPYTEAFKIETDPPSWLEGLKIKHCEGREEQFERWSKTNRCLLLDREIRQFFVGTVAEVRQWLIIRPALCPAESRKTLKPRQFNYDPERALINWLAGQTTDALREEFIAEWERRFHTRQSISACTGAAFMLGFEHDAVHRLMAEVFQSRDSE